MLIDVKTRVEVHIDARRIEMISYWLENAHGAEGGFIELIMYSGHKRLFYERTMKDVHEMHSIICAIMEKGWRKT